MKLIVENNISNYKNRVLKVIDDRKNEIFDFFGERLNCLPFDIYIYNTSENLVNGLKKRGFGEFPNYMCACHKDEDNSLNFFEPKDNPSKNEWSKDEYDDVIFHELVHGIQFSLFGSNYEWFNEGIAKCLDGTYKSGIKYLLENHINNNVIPPQQEIENEFGEHNYDSYDYSYIMVSYLLENMEKANFIELVKAKNKLDNVKENLLEKSINYYNKRYNIFNDEIIKK